MDPPDNSTDPLNPEAKYPESFGSLEESYIDPIFKPMSYDDLEDPEQYSPGGFHPIHLSDYLGPNNRYKVLHKLGSGGLSTVWLCGDVEKKVYVALKIVVAGASQDDCAELKLLRNDWDMKLSGGKQIALPSDHFWINGPNGHHLCLVLPVLGPRVSKIWDIFEDPGTLSRSIAQQVISGLEFLHQNGFCHGDLRPANILLQISNLDELSEDQIMKELGEPETDPLLTVSGEGHQLSTAPRYLVRPINTTTIPRKYLTEQISIIDFGESYEISKSPPQHFGIPPTYSSPEILLHDPTAATAGFPSDIWALSCTLFEIRSGQQLFQGMFDDEDDILMQMVQIFGKFPEPWWSSWGNRDRWFDEEGNPSTFLEDGRPTTQRTTLEDILAEGYHHIHFADGLFSGVESDGVRKSFSIPEDEIVVFSNLLYRMFLYDPSKRITAAEVAGHQWFAKS